MPPLRLDPDYAAAILAYTTLAPHLPLTARMIRDINNGVMRTIMLNLPCPEADFVEETTTQYTSTDGTTQTLHIFTPLKLTTTGSNSTTTSNSDSSDDDGNDDTPTRQPAILYIHGGGYISGSVDLYRKDIIRYAHLTQTTIFAPAYRLAPEHPHPNALEDVYGALRYLNDYADDLGVDAKRIALMGVDAGGGLAVGAALMARDMGGERPHVEKLVLVYPMLDDRTRLRPGSEVARYLTWNEVSNNIAWGAYLGRGAVGLPVVIVKREYGGAMVDDGEDGDATVDGEEEEEEGVDTYAAPGRAVDLRGLPRTYIDVGGLDLFRDECIEFATKLARGDVEFELHVYPGVPHSWEWMSLDAPVTRQAIANRVKTLKDV